MDDVFTLLDKLEQELVSAKNSLFSKKGMVDTQYCMQIIADIKNGLPSTIKKSQNILDEASDLINDSRKKAKEIIEEAERKADEIVSQSEILRRAERDAKLIRNEAIQFANTLKGDSKIYVDEMFADVEKFLADTIGCIRNNREELRGSIIKDK